MVWSERKNNSSDCYFCLTNITGIISKTKHTVKYPDMEPAMRPIPHSEELPVPKPPENPTLAMTTLILMKITDSKNGTMLIAIQHLKQALPHLNPPY